MMQTTPEPLPPAYLLPYEDLPPCRSSMRVGGPALFALKELNPEQVVDGEPVAAGLFSEDALMVGKMREKCPYCDDVPLQLVLRYRRVIRSHLYCEKCTRCFDAVYPDGSSALVPPTFPSE